MNVEDIEARLHKIAQSLTDKGFCRASAYAEFGSSHRVRVWFYYQTVDRYVHDDAKAPSFYGDGIEAAFQKAEAALGELLSLKEQRAADFTRRLAKMIEDGRDLGVADIIINPLTEAMKKLSENAITHQPHAAE